MMTSRHEKAPASAKVAANSQPQQRDVPVKDALRDAVPQTSRQPRKGHLEQKPSLL